MGKDGLINYTDYLFLMTMLSSSFLYRIIIYNLTFPASPNDILLAFYVYDVNADGHLDKEEFDRVQELLLNQSNVGQKHRDHSSMNMNFRKGASSALVKWAILMKFDLSYFIIITDTFSGLMGSKNWTSKGF